MLIGLVWKSGGWWRLGGKWGKVGVLMRGGHSEVSIVGTNHITALHIAAVTR